MKHNYMKTKTCTKCRIEKPITEYRKHRGSRDGLQYWCKDCHNAASDSWKHSRVRQRYEMPRIAKAKKLAQGICPKCGWGVIPVRRQLNGTIFQVGWVCGDIIDCCAEYVASSPKNARTKVKL